MRGKQRPVGKKGGTVERHQAARKKHESRGKDVAAISDRKLSTENEERKKNDTTRKELCWRWEITSLRRSATWQWPLWLEGKQLNGSKHSLSLSLCLSLTHTPISSFHSVIMQSASDKQTCAISLPLVDAFLSVNLWQCSAGRAFNLMCE